MGNNCRNLPERDKRVPDKIETRESLENIELQIHNCQDQIDSIDLQTKQAQEKKISKDSELSKAFAQVFLIFQALIFQEQDKMQLRIIAKDILGIETQLAELSNQRNNLHETKQQLLTKRIRIIGGETTHEAQIIVNTNHHYDSNQVMQRTAAEIQNTNLQQAIARQQVRATQQVADQEADDYIQQLRNLRNQNNGQA
ncbi:UNKNOWN [Stylonychia lemnae]|uniref:Uncharacterized protein n=1 Tax=Stylonychia lemnae TaxID=5949 RepID=A0A077ZY38_STYLE|nr:UNKNOWN [Stylonychia lemnae]|eukprot:CDW73446.1 UNKNOWN [Stylonychia lemnae]